MARLRASRSEQKIRHILVQFYNDFNLRDRYLAFSYRVEIGALCLGG